MRKTIILALLLLIAVFTMSAASVTADEFEVDSLSDGSSIGNGLTLSLNGGTASILKAENVPENFRYSKLLSLADNASLAFDASASDMLRITAASASDIVVSSGDNTAAVSGELSDDGTVEYEYEIPADGSYSISSSDDMSIYEINVE